MSSHFDNVIVFGPTGAVGGVAALEASKRGAKVWLAMRDPSKPIAAIPPSQETSSSFSRVQADLSDSASIKHAVTISGARAAYLYLVPTNDGLKSALTAMKDAGIEYVVFLSTFSLKSDEDIRQVGPDKFIPFIHAQVEITLEDLSIPHVTLRPAAFASNPFNMTMNMSTEPWTANVLDPSWVGDQISPIDIGRVAAAVLVDRPSAEQKETIYICGPKLLTQSKQLEIIGSVLKKEIKVVEQTPEEQGRIWTEEKGLPPVAVGYLLKAMRSSVGTTEYPEPWYSNSVANIKKYSGYEPMQFEEYVREWQKQQEAKV